MNWTAENKNSEGVLIVSTMLDFFRNLRKSEAEKRQEAITAYLDDVLTAGERRRLEEQLAADPALRADLDQQRSVKLNLSRLPRSRAPRNFTLDPALYGRPARQSSPRLYPAMRVATVLVGVFFIVAVGAEILTFDTRSYDTSNVVDQFFAQAPAADVVMEAEAEMVPEADTAASLEPEPQLGAGAEGAVSESEELFKEEQLEEESPNLFGAASDEDMVESAVAAEENLADVLLTAVSGTAVERAVTREATAENAPRAPTPTEKRVEPVEAPPADIDDRQADLPSGGGGEPEEAPMPGVVLTVETGRNGLAAAETATSQPGSTMVAVPQEEEVAEAPGEALAEPFAPLLEENGPAFHQDVFSRLSARQLVILLLGIFLVILAGMTLIIRWRLKE